MEPVILLLAVMAATELARISQTACSWLAARTLTELARAREQGRR